MTGVAQRIDRRGFLRIAAAAAAGTAGLGLAACAGDTTDTGAAKKRPPARATRPDGRAAAAGRREVTQTKLASGVIVPTAPWLIAENRRPGTLDWIVNFVQPDHALEGFASQVSAVSGDDVALFVNTEAAAVQVHAYRMGYYQGLGGRLVYQSDMVRATPQPAPTVSAGTGTVSCPWTPTLSFKVDDRGPRGATS